MVKYVENDCVGVYKNESVDSFNYVYILALDDSIPKCMGFINSFISYLDFCQNVTFSWD